MCILGPCTCARSRTFPWRRPRTRAEGRGGREGGREGCSRPRLGVSANDIRRCIVQFSPARSDGARRFVFAFYCGTLASPPSFPRLPFLCCVRYSQVSRGRLPPLSLSLSRSRTRVVESQKYIAKVPYRQYVERLLLSIPIQLEGSPAAESNSP